MNNIDKIYMDAFLKSMKKDLKKWKLDIIGTIDGTYFQYKSPQYDRVRFVFGDYVGAYINDQFDWYVPIAVLYNPFNEYFWKFRKSKKILRQYLNSKRNEKYSKKLEKALEKVKQLQ
jgi:hypothetical protein